MTVQSNSPMVMTSLTEELKKLTKQGWYWRPITLWEVEGKLVNTPDGSFLGLGEQGLLIGSSLPCCAAYPVRLSNLVSRFLQVCSLQYLCRFVIGQYTWIDLILTLPLSNKMKDYLQEKHY
ncbi:hypothetical protein K5549_005804 [Capra hircus]|nr:hypothetical protein K5549_005804 [Capra hircus]